MDFSCLQFHKRPLEENTQRKFTAKIQKNHENICTIQKNVLNLHSQSPGGGMVDALVSGASVERRAGSSPVLGTHFNRK